jgi:hypothetical protein
MCHCPGSGHKRGDKNSSLTVDIGRRLLLHCFAGCSFGEVRERLALCVCCRASSDPSARIAGHADEPDARRIRRCQGLAARDGFVVKQDDQVIAQRGNGRAALVEFESKLEHGLADLRLYIGDIVSSRCIDLSSDDKDDDAGRNLKDVIVDVASERIEDAFSDFNWSLQRALRQLRRALR